MEKDELLIAEEELPGISCDVQGPPGPISVDLNSLSLEEYHERLNEQALLSRKEILTILK